MQTYKDTTKITNKHPPYTPKLKQVHKHTKNKLGHKHKQTPKNKHLHKHIHKNTNILYKQAYKRKPQTQTYKCKHTVQTNIQTKNYKQTKT